MTVLAPGATGPGNWVGCPSILWDPSRERFLLTYRRRARGADRRPTVGQARLSGIVSDQDPWLVSPHTTGSLRYVDGIEREGEYWLYYEAARADGSHELRLNRVPVL